MPTTYAKADAEVKNLMQSVMEMHHAELVEVDTRVCLIMATAAKDEHGRPFAPAVKLHGVQCAAVAKIVPYKRRAIGHEDCEITIDADNWEALTEPEREALLDHELYHFEVQRDEEGHPKADDCGRPKFKSRMHDHDFGWFNVIAKRHGDASYEVKQAKAFADQHGQTYFGWGKPPMRGPESAKLKNSDLVPLSEAMGAKK